MLRDFFIYGLGGAASRVAAVFLVPLYTRTLDVAGYGQLELLLALHALFVLTIGLQGESAVLRDYFSAREKGEVGQLAWGAVAMMGLGIVVIAPLAAVAYFTGWLYPEIAVYLPLIAGLTVAAQLVGIQLILIRFSGKPIAFATYSFLDVLVTAAISVTLMVGFGWGIWGALTGMTVSKVLIMVFAWRRSFGALPDPLPSRATLRRMIAYAVPTMPSVLLNWLQTNGTRVILAIFLTYADVALASVAIRVAALFGFLIYSFRLAWEPWAFRQLDLPDRDDGVFDRLLTRFTLGMFLPAAGTIVVAPLVVAVFAPPTYAAATGLLGFFVLGQYWLGIANITSIGVHGARVTSRLTVIFGIGALLNLGLLALLAPRIGVLGAAVAFLAGSIASAAIAAKLSEWHYETRFSWRLLIAASGASVTAAAGAWVIYGHHLAMAGDQPVWARMALAAAMLLVCFALVTLAGASGAQRSELRGDLLGYHASAKSAMARLGQRRG